MTQTVPTQDQLPDTDWQENYKMQAQQKLTRYESFIKDTDYYDFNNAIIVEAVNDIKAIADSDRDAIDKTLKFVFSNVEYVFGEADGKCLNGNAPEILESGLGQCDTQSMVVISMLRNMGIASVPVGGCVLSNNNCALQSILPLQSIQDLGLGPKFEPLEDIDPDAISYSRSSATSRGLHAWVSVWLPDEGWVELEATTGKFADTRCFTYHVELYPKENQKDLFCTSKNLDYARACFDSDIDKMTQEGLGVVGSVTP